MKILITVKANAKERKVEKTAEGQFVVRVKAPAKEGKANKEVIEVLADYFQVSKSCISIVTGQNSKHKIVKIES